MVNTSVSLHKIKMMRDKHLYRKLSCTCRSKRGRQETEGGREGERRGEERDEGRGKRGGE